MQINIKNFKTKALIGLNQNERFNKQDLIINLSVEIEYQSSSDEITETINYDEIKNIIIKKSEECRYKLLESFTDDLARAIQEIPKIERIELEVKKPLAIKEADYTSIKVCL